VTEKRVEQTGLFRTRSIDLQDITEAHWRSTKNMGKVVLRTEDTKLVIDLSRYQKHQQQELVKYFLHCLDEDIQRDWDKFWNLNWWRFDELDTSNPEDTREETRKVKLRMFYLVLGGYFGIALCSFLVWLYTAQNPNLSKHRPPGLSLSGMIFFNVIFLLLGGSLVYGITASKGRVRKAFPVEEKGKGFIAFGVVGALLTMPVVVVALLFLGKTNPDPGTVTLAIIVIVLIFGGIEMLGIWKLDKHRKKVESEAAKMAEEMYIKFPKESEKTRMKDAREN
jgi:FtsH-binding integral membrane protein